MTKSMREDAQRLIWLARSYRDTAAQLNQAGDEKEAKHRLLLCANMLESTARTIATESGKDMTMTREQALKAIEDARQTWHNAWAEYVFAEDLAFGAAQNSSPEAKARVKVASHREHEAFEDAQFAKRQYKMLFGVDYFPEIADENQDG